MNLTESLLLALREHGARQIFGIPGDFALPYFRVIEESQILPLFTLSHEPAVGFAADAAARMLGGVGVAAVTYGAGALNMINPVAAAYAEKSPLVVLSGGPGRNEGKSGLLLHHQAKTLDSQFQIFKEISCDQVRLDDAARAPADIARVLGNCRRHSRPVYIELPRDMVGVPCQPVRAEQPSVVDAEALAAPWRSPELTRFCSPKRTHSAGLARGLFGHGGACAARGSVLAAENPGDVSPG